MAHIRKVKCMGSCGWYRDYDFETVGDELIICPNCGSSVITVATYDDGYHWGYEKGYKETFWREFWTVFLITLLAIGVIIGACLFGAPMLTYIRLWWWVP